MPEQVLEQVLEQAKEAVRVRVRAGLVRATPRPQESPPEHPQLSLRRCGSKPPIEQFSTRRRRSAAIQNYVQPLPVEFRKSGGYYEALEE